jgi:putative DNA primase/helicase
MTDYAKIIEEFTLQEPGIVLERVSDIPAQKLTWLWPGRIPLGKLSLFAGDPGLGKSLVTLDIIARVTCGREWPDGTANTEPGSVIILSAEDDPADTIRPRLETARANLSKVHILKAVRRTRPGGSAALDLFNLESDLVELQHAAVKLGDVRLIVIDPISAYLGNTDSHVNAKVRGLLAPLTALAQILRIAIIAVDHLSKSNRPALYRPNGSIAFTAAARAVWLFAKNPDDDSQRLMLPGKMNLARDQQGLTYGLQELESGAVTVEWGHAVRLLADEVLQPEAIEQRSERREAMEWLRDVLSSGPVSAKKIRADAKKAGITLSTLRRAEDALCVEHNKSGFEGGWSWQLPHSEGAHEISKMPTVRVWAPSAMMGTFDMSTTPESEEKFDGRG